MDQHCDCSRLGKTDYEQSVCQDNCYNLEMLKRDITNAYMWYKIADLILSVALLVGVAGIVPVLLLVFVYGFKIVLLAYNVLVLSILFYYEVSILYIVVAAVVSYLIGWVFIFYSCIVVSSLYRIMVNSDEYGEDEY